MPHQYKYLKLIKVIHHHTKREFHEKYFEAQFRLVAQILFLLRLAKGNFNGDSSCVIW